MSAGVVGPVAIAFPLKRVGIQHNGGNDAHATIPHPQDRFFVILAFDDDRPRTGKIDPLAPDGALRFAPNLVRELLQPVSPVRDYAPRTQRFQPQLTEPLTWTPPARQGAQG